MIEATITEIRDFFEMTMTEMKNEWTALTSDEKAYFKVAVAEAIGKK